MEQIKKNLSKEGNHQIAKRLNSERKLAGRNSLHNSLSIYIYARRGVNIIPNFKEGTCTDFARCKVKGYLTVFFWSGKDIF